MDLIVSFIKESGVRLILEDLKEAAKRNAEIRILCGSYLGITEPAALSMLFHELPETVQIRFYMESRRSFHPKSYLFKNADGSEEAYIGSSNLSASALTDAIEWNYCIRSDEDRKTILKMRDEFDVLFHKARTVDEKLLQEYADSWIRPKISNRFSDDEFQMDTDSERLPGSALVPVPRGAQIEALYALEKTRKQGYSKAMIQAATGVGKTYLAAFDSQPYKRILFVAHRHEILEQAARTFKKVRPDLKIGLLDQNHKELSADILMASVFTLSSDKILNPKKLPADAFDYIIIDEFHHAAAASYQKIIDYFRPKFLLGLTATPDRLDGRSVYALCDFNVPYTIDLRRAINRGLLAPFRYYAVYDDTDYSRIRKTGGHYRIEDLEQAYESSKTRSLSILKHYRKYPSQQAIAFCASKAHASLMARYFNENGIASAAVYSNSGHDPYALERSEAIDKLKRGQVKVLFTVDMFNEGLDVDSIDMVLFLRPTESSTIFLQQLGRGLRLSENKEYLTVLDFIGNYDQAFRTPALLSGISALRAPSLNLNQLSFPEGCLYDFDLELIDLFEKIRKQKRTKAEWLKQEYIRIRELIGHRPSQKELFENLDDELLEAVLSDAALNPFRSYLSFLNGMGDLNEEEKKLLDSAAGKFISRLEKTSMSRIYKMPVLMSLLDHQDHHILMKVSEERILESWKDFFAKNENWKDLGGKKQELSLQEFRSLTDRQHLLKIRSQPVHFLVKSESEFFAFEKGSLSLSSELFAWSQNPDFYTQVKNVLEFRSELYYYSRFQKSAGGNNKS